MDEVQSFSALLAGLSIADRNSTEQHQATLAAAIRDVIQAVSILSRLLTVDKDVINTENGTEICSLRTATNKLASVAHAFNDVVHRSIVAKVISMGGRQGHDISKLLEHFHRHILAIAEKIIGESKNDADVLWRIAEECHNQAISSSGKLDPDNYFALIEESYPESPYDSQLESEEYYEHENRLDFDEEYAELWRRHAEFREQRSNSWKIEFRGIWIRFWARALSKCPGGPTLFQPPARLTATPTGWPTKDIPRYLFRAFDSNSTGRSNHNVVASVASMDEASDSGRVDLFSLEGQDASNMLHDHLDKGCFLSYTSDNLMSWSSSLMFVIQYAIWRFCIGNPTPDDVWICAVDTRKFPQGQFAKDEWLLNAYDNTELDAGQKRFRRLRLDMPQYKNGEYLSQGTLNHNGRSCIFSLRNLEEAGLYDLYPEFSDPLSKGQWTNRVRDLRCFWESDAITDVQDLLAACSIAKKCFGAFDVWDIIWVLLGFRRRDLETAGLQDDPNIAEIPEPAEVRRYMKLIRMSEYYGQKSGSASEHDKKVFHERIMQPLYDILEYK